MLLCHLPGSCLTCWHSRKIHKIQKRLQQLCASFILGMMSHVTAFIRFVDFEVT